MIFLKYYLKFSLAVRVIIIWHTVSTYDGEGNGNPLQCSCLENPRDCGAWWAAIFGAAQSWTRLSDCTFIFTFMHWRRQWQPTYCSTLCDAIDGSPLGSPIPGILQARTVSGLPLPSPMHESENESAVAQSCTTLSDPMDCSLPGSSVHGFSRQEYWSGVPLPFPRQMPRPTNSESLRPGPGNLHFKMPQVTLMRNLRTTGLVLRSGRGLEIIRTIAIQVNRRSRPLADISFTYTKKEIIYNTGGAF